MTRRIVFQIHWFLGITAGFVLALMGLTGAMMSFEDEIMAAISADTMTVARPGGAPMTPGVLTRTVSATQGGAAIETLYVEADPHLAWRVNLAGGKGHGAALYVDPRTGAVLGERRGEAFFDTVRRLHRWLALPGNGNGIGRQITGIAALSLIFFALSGLYLRWPRRALDWRAWLALDLRMRGRNLHRALHAVIGTWIFAAYLLSGLTGLWWSYDWYRKGATRLLTGQAAEAPRDKTAGRTPASSAVPPEAALDRTWATLTTVTRGRYDRVIISMPKISADPVRYRVLLPGARHARMVDLFSVDSASGGIVKADRYADKTTGQAVATSMYEVHRGAFFGLGGRILIFLTSLTMPLFTVTGLLLYLARRRRKQALRDVHQTPATARAAPSEADGLLVAYASQTGGAERLARQTAAAFGDARVLPLAQVDAEVLAETRRALFVVSTYGDGEAPDMVRGFARKRMTMPPPAHALEYAVLALGDRDYPDFCAFGHKLDHWLHSGGGRRLFDLVEMDGEDADAQRHWQQQLAALGGTSETPDWAPAPYARWRIAERTLLNPGSAGGAVHRIALVPEAGDLPRWAAGDLVEVQPRNASDRVAEVLSAFGYSGDTLVGDRTLAEHLGEAILADLDGATPEALVANLRPLAHREYSIASIPEDGRLELVVRAVTREDGHPGIASYWLSHQCPIGGTVTMRVRANPGFHAPDPAAPMILIGNGTGIAGLRAHLRQAALTGSKRHWLLFGERNAGADALFAGELTDWLADGTLARLDRAFSRDSECGRYVQHLLDLDHPALDAAVSDGATILVCGSLNGMAPAVDDALRRALGDTRLEQLAEAGRYRRDIY